MRVLAVCADPGIPLDATKGATVHLLAVWRALARAGATVVGVAPVRGSAPMPVHQSGLEIRPVRDTREGPDALATDLEACALAAAGERTPDVVLERLALHSDLGARIAHRFGIPLAVEVNAPLEDEAMRFRGAAPDPAAAAAHRAILSAADLVYCVSEPLAPYVLERGARSERVWVLPNGVDTARFARPPEASASPPPEAERAGGVSRAVSPRVRFGFVGSFKAWHGCELLLEAFGRVCRERRDVELAMIGDGPTRLAMEALARGLGLDAQVRFLGARRHEEIPAFLHELDVAIAPAPAGIAYYFSPLKVYEYAAAGCAMIAPRAGQVAERFEHGRDAWLVPPGSAGELAAAMLHLAGDAGLRRRLGMAAAARARESFDWSHVADRLLERFARLHEARAAAADPARSASGGGA